MTKIERLQSDGWETIRADASGTWLGKQRGSFYHAKSFSASGRERTHRTFGFKGDAERWAGI